jgi:hypothetical protein
VTMCARVVVGTWSAGRWFCGSFAGCRAAWPASAPTAPPSTRTSFATATAPLRGSHARTT